MSEDQIEEGFVSGIEEFRTVGRYRIIRKVGHGGTGVVYLGRDDYIKRDVAVKISLAGSDRARETFLVETQSAGRLQHPNIVAIYDAGVCKDYCYITMEYVEGPPLEEYCRKDQLLPLGKTLEIILDMCHALDYADKKGVIHRDIKPSNIIFDKAGTAKITDFSVAQMTEHTAPMGIFGTPSYMSPEQLKDEVLTIQNDIFSVGCVLYELLTGERAFSGDNSFSIMYKTINEEPKSILEIRPDLPKILEEITRKALAKDLKVRYQTCMDLAYDLNVARRGLTGEIKGRKKTEDVVGFVHNLPFFHNFNRGQVEELVSASRIVKVKRGKVIMSEGEIDDTFYILLSGEVKVVKNGRKIALIEVGKCFGEMAYIGHQPRVANVLAATDCILLKVSAPLLENATESIQLLFFKNFARTLVQRLCKSP